MLRFAGVRLITCELGNVIVHGPKVLLGTACEQAIEGRVLPVEGQVAALRIAGQPAPVLQVPADPGAGVKTNDNDP